MQSPPNTSADPSVENTNVQTPQPEQTTPEVTFQTTGPEDNFATASLVLGIISFLGSFLPICGFLFALIGIVLGVKGGESKQKKTQARIGIVLSVVGIVASVFFGLFYIFLDVISGFS